MFFVYVFIQKCVYISTPFIKHVHSTFKNIKSELTFYPFVPSTVCLNAAEKRLCALIRRLQNCPFCLSFCFRFKHTTVPLTSTFTSMLHAGGKHTLCGHLHEKKSRLGSDSSLLFTLISHLQDVSSVTAVGFDSFTPRPKSGLLVISAGRVGPGRCWRWGEAGGSCIFYIFPMFCCSRSPLGLVKR